MKPVSLFSLLVTLIGGGVLLAVASVLEFIVGGVLGFVFFERLLGKGFGVPFRFFQLGLFGLSEGLFSASRIVFDWVIWCLVFAALFHGVRALMRGHM